MENTTGGWPDVRRWLQENAPEALEVLDTPASSRELMALAATVGRRLPAGLRAAWGAHNGSLEVCPLFGALQLPPGLEWVRGLRWLTVEEAQEEWYALKDWEGGIWDLEWVPFAADEDGHRLYVCTRTQQVFAWDAFANEGEGESFSIAKTMEALVEQIVADMRAGKIGADSEGVLFRLEGGQGAKGPAQKGPTVGERFLALLEEAGWIELEADGRDLFLRALDKAFDLPDDEPEEKREVIHALLLEHPSVAELYASEEQLDPLLDEFV